MIAADSRARVEAAVEAEACMACGGPVRRGHVVTAVTIFVDALRRPDGEFVFEGPDGLLLPDAHGFSDEPHFHRHRCVPVRRVEAQT
jgi:hypothetical protein